MTSKKLSTNLIKLDSPQIVTGQHLSVSDNQSDLILTVPNRRTSHSPSPSPSMKRSPGPLKRDSTLQNNHSRYNSRNYSRAKQMPGPDSSQQPEQSDLPEVVGQPLKPGSRARSVLVENRKARISQQLNTIPDKSSSTLRKKLDLTGKKPGQKVTIRFKPIRTYAPEDLRVTLTETSKQKELNGGEILNIDGNIAFRFAPKENGIYVADVIVKSTNKSILVKPLEIVVTGLEIDFTSSDIMNDILKRKEEKKRKQVRLSSKRGTKINQEDSIEITGTDEKSERVPVNIVRYRLPAELLLPENTVVSCETIPELNGTVSKVQNYLTVDFQYNESQQDLIISVPDPLEKTISNFFTIKYYTPYQGSVGQSILYPIKPVYTQLSLPSKTTISDFVLIVKGPKKLSDNNNTSKVAAEIIKKEDNFYVLFTPWVKGLYKIIVRYFSELYLFAAVPVKEGIIVKQLVSDKIYQNTKNAFFWKFPPIITQRGKKITYSVVDLLVVYNDSEKKYLGDITLGEDGSLYIHIKLKKPGNYKYQIYLWDIPILANEIQFIWEDIGNLSPRTEILIKDLNLLATEASRAARNLKTNLTHKNAQFLQMEIFCEVCSTKIHKILSYKNLNWAEIILEDTAELRTLFITIVKLQLSFINLYANNLALIENVKQLQNILHHLSEFPKNCSNLIKLMIITLETKQDERKNNIGEEFLEIFNRFNAILIPLDEIMKIYTKENTQTLIITKIDLMGKSRDEFREQIIRFLENEEDNFIISDSLICSPHRMPNSIVEAIELFQRHYKQLLSLFEQEGIENIVLVSNLCKTIFVLEKMVLEKWIKMDKEEKFHQLWKNYKEKLIWTIGDYLEKKCTGDFRELDTLVAEIISELESKFKSIN